MKSSHQRTVVGIELKVIQLLLVLDLFVVALRKYGNLRKALKALRLMWSFGEKIIGGRKRRKAYYSQGQYSFSMFHPKWPSYSFRKYCDTVFESFVPTNSSTIRLLLLAITKKCPLACEHCSEWDSLNSEDVLSLAEWQNLLDEWMSKGVGQIVYSGGEPLARYSDLVSLINRYSGKADQWIYSSGFGLTLQKAYELKEAGLDGVAISIDSHLPEAHNNFRGSHRSFQFAVEAIRNCQKAGILTALNVCPSRNYINSGYLDQYMSFAAKLGVPFVTVLEPRAVGHYHGKDVEFSGDEKKIIEKLFYEMNLKPAFKDYPIIEYPALGRKKTATCGGGLAFIFIDYDGRIHNCPFCKVKWTTDKKFSECTADMTTSDRQLNRHESMPLPSEV